jgi:hypothetical protein
MHHAVYGHYKAISKTLHCATPESRSCIYVSTRINAKLNSQSDLQGHDTPPIPASQAFNGHDSKYRN